MEDKLVTLAILTYAKAQILKNVLENEGILKKIVRELSSWERVVRIRKILI